MSEVKLQGLYYDMSSEDYHNKPGTFSSSQMKDLLEDPEIFYRKYITKEQERISIPAFDVGTYFHTAILEPDKLKNESAVYVGVRRGKEWEKFQVENAGKNIITESEQKVADGLIKAVQSSPIAMGRISRGTPEVSGFVDLVIFENEIYSLDGKFMLGKYGWIEAKKKPSKKESVIIPMKVRADLLAEMFILDLKSTTGNVKSDKAMKLKVSDYNYDLSAALYLDLFTLLTGKVISEFVWTFASKDYFNCKSYIATAENIQVGRAKYRKAILTLAENIENNWQFSDSMGFLGPNVWEMAILKEKAEDLL